MKLILPLLTACLISLPAVSHAESIDADKAKDALKKLLGDVSEAAEKATKKSDEDDDVHWKRSKENLTMEREEYTKKVTKALAFINVEIQAAADTDSSVGGKDYYKTRIKSLQEHAKFCAEDLERLNASASEEEFRSKQRFFDRSVAYLAEYVAITVKEAGL